jgi:hypothetical protein
MQLHPLLNQLELPPGRLEPRLLTAVARIVADEERAWRPIVRHDPGRRWYRSLFRNDDYEVWLLGWDVGQDIVIHDHGGSSGAFVVTDGRLIERHTQRSRRGPLRIRAHGVGQGASFGPAYVHDLGNAGPGVATSVHAYSPPLTTMTYYDLADGLPVVRRPLLAEVSW